MTEHGTCPEFVSAKAPGGGAISAAEDFTNFSFSQESGLWKNDTLAR
jgi:hypothetical protein